MGDNLSSLTVIFTEFYYWVTVVFMFLIHVGFCMYEIGASRRKNHLHTLMKNTMAIPLVTVTFYFFGWWIYFAFINGPGIIWRHDLGPVCRTLEPADGNPSFGSITGAWAFRPTALKVLPTGTGSMACSGRPSCCSRSPRPRSSRGPSLNGPGLALSGSSPC